MKILITGSGGFVGGSLGHFAMRMGHEVLGISRSGNPGSDWRGQYIKHDFEHSDFSTIIREIAPDLILHGAGTASVSRSFDDPLDDLQSGLMTWARLLSGVHRSGVKPLIVFPSSAAVYGNSVQLPLREDAPVEPISPYGFHKAACELLAREYATCFGLDIIVCRFFSLFGPSQRRLLMWELYEQFINPNSTIWLQGTGDEARDYLHIDDASAVIVELAEKLLRMHRTGQCLIINVASGTEIKVKDLARQIGELVAPEKQIHCRGIERQGDPRRWRADVSLLRSLAPTWQSRPLSSTLSQCIEAWRKEKELSAYGV